MSCSSDTPAAYKDLEEEYQAYESYIVNNMLMSDTGILDADAIDKTDLVYKEWTEDETISLKEFLTYAIQQNWLDITKITSGYGIYGYRRDVHDTGGLHFQLSV